MCPSLLFSLKQILYVIGKWQLRCLFPPGGRIEPEPKTGINPLFLLNPNLQYKIWHW